MPIERKKIEVRFEREPHGDFTFDVLYIDGKEIVSYNIDNIDKLFMEHTPETIVKSITDYFANKK